MGPSSGKKTEDSSVAEHEIVVKRQKGLGAKSLIFACGSALFSDGYANASIGPVNTILGILYPTEYADTNYSQLLSSMAFAGTIVGMLSFGWLSDKIGRKVGMLWATGILFVFSALCAGAKGPGGSIPGMFKMLIAWRFLLGIGIGAEYPSGSVACSENTEAEGVAKNRQQRYFQLATNTMIDFGFVVASFVPLILLWIAGMDHLRLIWRLTLGLGVIPPLVLLFFRIKMHEPEAYLKHGMRHARIPWKLILRRYWVKLTAISIAWFIYDWITYPFGIYSSIIVSVADPDSTLYTSLGWGVFVNALYIPGTLVGALFFSDRFGPKYTMIFGLVMQSIIGFALSGAYTPLTQPGRIAGFAIMYGLFLAFGELGPGNCLGLLASKAIGPSAVRGQLYGIAAAVGKVGAFIGSYTFKPIIQDLGGSGTYKGDTGPFYIGSALALVSAIIVYFFIPNIDADYMERENIAFRAYLEENGWDVSQMGVESLISDPEFAGSQPEKGGSVNEHKIVPVE